METTTSNTKKANKRYVIFQNLLPTNDPDIPNPRIDIVTKGDNVVEFYPKDKEYIHNPEAKGVTSLHPGETKKIFLKTKKAPDQLGINEDEKTATLNIYMYASVRSQLVKVHPFGKIMSFKLVNDACGIPNRSTDSYSYKGIGLFTNHINHTASFPLIKDKLEEK
jgi:hypothetical protein